MAAFFKSPRGFILSILMLSLAGMGMSKADTITLGWDPETDTNVVGYIVYYGTQSGQLTNSVDVGSQTIFTSHNLAPGQTYFFSVAAYDTSQVVGDASGEVSYLVPGLTTLVQGPAPGYHMILSFPVEPYYTYEIQASTDLINWATLYVTPDFDFNDWVYFPDLDAVNYSQRFYRVVPHPDAN